MERKVDTGEFSKDFSSINPVIDASICEQLEPSASCWDDTE